LDKKIPDQIIEELLFAAMQAPSARDKQPWHFIVINDKKILDQIPSFCPYAQMCKNAPLAILPCGDISLESSEYWIQDLAAATQNLLLAVHEKKLGAVWTGVYPKEDRIEEFQELLSLPKEIIPFALIVLGYPQEKPSYRENFKKDRIHYNNW
jgi:nitroreductase